MDAVPASVDPPGAGAALQPMRRRRHRSSSEELTTGERQALEDLQRADGVLARWPVGRIVTRSLSHKGFIVVYPDFVLLTDAGRRALTQNQQ
jgi:hypothetical protein